MGIVKPNTTRGTIARASAAAKITPPRTQARRSANAPGRHISASTIRIGYSHTPGNTNGAISPHAMPPATPPAEIHM
jgi:hypothetical protein